MPNLSLVNDNQKTPTRDKFIQNISSSRELQDKNRTSKAYVYVNEDKSSVIIIICHGRKS